MKTLQVACSFSESNIIALWRECSEKTLQKQCYNFRTKMSNSMVKSDIQQTWMAVLIGHRCWLRFFSVLLILNERNLGRCGRHCCHTTTATSISLLMALILKTACKQWSCIQNSGLPLQRATIKLIPPRTRTRTLTPTGTRERERERGRAGDAHVLWPLLCTNSMMCDN